MQKVKFMNFEILSVIHFVLECACLEIVSRTYDASVRQWWQTELFLETVN